MDNECQINQSNKNVILKLIIGIILAIIGIGLIVLAMFMKDTFKTAKVFYYLVNIAGAISIFIAISLIYAFIVRNKPVHQFCTKEITMIGIQSAITVLLYYFVKFPLPFFPPWLDIQVSELPALITGFAYGPYAGSLVILIRFIIKLPATITAGVGELADLILGLTLVIISGIIYKKHKTLKGALVGTSIGMGVATLMAVLLNRVLLIPAYMYFAGFKMEMLVGALNGIFKGSVTANNFYFYYLVIGVLPFNLFRYLIVGVFTFLLYKRIGGILKSMCKTKCTSKSA